MMDKGEKKILVGTVERVTFHNPDNGFTVLELSYSGDSVTVVTNTVDLAPGEELELVGRFDHHSIYGPQFRAEKCVRRLPSGAGAILKYLSSGAIKGIGPATARRMVDRFGDKTFEIMKDNPERIAEIKGISAEKAAGIAEEFARKFGLQEVMLYLAKFDVTPDEALKAYKRLGRAACELIERNPYALCMDGIGFSFERADLIAEKSGLPQDNPHRIMAGVEHILKHNTRNGHTCLPREKLIPVAAALLDCDSELCEAYVDELVGSRHLVSKIIREREFLFLPDLYRSESYCAQRLALMLSFPPMGAGAAEREIDTIEKAGGITYAKKQREAILSALDKGVLILTGGPGTGKTTTLNAMISLMEKRGLDVVLAAPTGRAAKRMSEVTGREAKTIHRLLEVEWTNDDDLYFSRNERNPLEADAVIVDELSMVDVTVFEHLLRSLRLGCRLIMVGDSDQLPSVGAGNVLQDLIDSGAVPYTRLDEVFRQAMESLIVTNAHAIVAGQMPELSSKTSDFFMMNTENPKIAASTVVDLYTRRLRDAYGYEPTRDIQILCPSRKMELGTLNLNASLQQTLNPYEPGKNELKMRGYILRTGDKVMQIKNNYDIVWSTPNGEEGTGVFNGDVGILESIDLRNSTLTVKFDERAAVYTAEEAEQLEPAYAVTVHKSQGSEFPCVILPLLDCPSKLRYRNLLYTAVTRAKERLIIVGSKGVVSEMVTNNRKSRRFTALCELLKAEVFGEDN